MNNRYSGYHPGDSFLHSMQARSKVLLALGFIILAGTGSGYVLFVIALLCHFGMWISGISFSNAYQRLEALKIFLLVLGGPPLFLTPGTPILLFDEFTLPVTGEGLECGVFAVSRLALIIWISMTLLWTTSPRSLMKMVSGSGSKIFPGSKFFREFVFIGVLAFQILPDLFAEAEEVIGKSRDMGTPGNKASRFETMDEKTKADSYFETVKEKTKKHSYFKLVIAKANRESYLKTVKEKTQSLIAWTVAVLAEPERLGEPKRLARTLRKP